MPAGAHIALEFTSPNSSEDVERDVAFKFAPQAERHNYKLEQHSKNGALFSRRYWPAGAIVGFVLGWIIAATGYSNSADSVTGVAPGVYVAGAIAVACLFVRRSENLRMTFEERQGGSVIMVDGHATKALRAVLEDLAAETPPPGSLERLPAPGGGVPGPSSDDPVEKIERLAKLRDSGALSSEEFNVKKAELLDEV